MIHTTSHTGRGARRDLAKEHFWRKTLGELAQANASVRAFCQARGLSEASLYAWRRILRQRPVPSSDASGRALPAFLPVSVGADIPVMEIVLRGDRRIRVRGPVDRVALTDVLAVLEPPPC